MQHEALLGLAFEDFKTLHVVAGAQSGRNQSLSFAAGEDCRTVRTRQHANFDPNVANLIKRAAIGTALLVNHSLAEQTLAQGLVVSLQLLLSVLVVLRN